MSDDAWLKKMKERMKPPEQRQREATAEEQRLLKEDAARREACLSKAMETIASIVQMTGEELAGSWGVRGADVGLDDEKVGLWFHAVDGMVVVRERGHEIARHMPRKVHGKWMFDTSPHEIAQGQIEGWMERTGKLKS